MSFSSSDTSALSSIGANAGIPSLNVADIPANIRNGNQQAQQAYSEGLAFEQVLVNQLTTQLANTMGSGAMSTADGSSGSSTDTTDNSGLLGGSSASAYSSLIPQALTSSIMDGGGMGLAEQFAQELDPALADPTASTSSSATAAAATGSTSANAATGSDGVTG